MRFVFPGKIVTGLWSEVSCWQSKHGETLRYNTDCVYLYMDKQFNSWFNTNLIYSNVYKHTPRCFNSHSAYLSRKHLSRWRKYVMYVKCSSSHLVHVSKEIYHDANLGLSLKCYRLFIKGNVLKHQNLSSLLRQMKCRVIFITVQQHFPHLRRSAVCCRPAFVCSVLFRLAMEM